MRSLALGTALLLVSAAALHAQTSQTRATPPPPDGGSSEVLQSIYVPPLPNAPFTLTLATEWVRPLGTDGNTITLVNQRKIARDRAGRIYQERVLLRPPNTAGPWVTNWIQITDPAAHTWLNCSVFARVCHTLPYNDSTTAPELESGTTRFQGGAQQRTSLGREMFAGVEVIGVHVSTVINAGQMGNAKPLTTEREYWYSAALGFNLRSTRNDPRSGRQSFTVTELSRDEPDPALWQVPAGYLVADERAGTP